jgi:hypothetical protein
MRLIDVDELKKRATKVMFRDAPECGEFDAVAVDDVDCMPTIDPESLRPTAHWKRIQDVAYMCTYCKSCFAFIPYNYQYCPECGAKMSNAYAFARER